MVVMVMGVLLVPLVVGSKCHVGDGVSDCAVRIVLLGLGR